MFGVCPEKTRNLKVKTRRDQLSLAREVWNVVHNVGEKLLEIGHFTVLYYVSPLLLYLYVIIRVLLR